MKVDKVNSEPPENAKNKILFENLTPLHPTVPFILERDIKSEENLTGRIIDIVAPIGKGPARPDRIAAEGGQDGHPAAHRATPSRPIILR